MAKDATWTFNLIRKRLKYKQQYTKYNIWKISSGHQPGYISGATEE